MMTWGHGDTQGEGHVTTGVETAVRHLQAEELRGQQSPPEAGRAWKRRFCAGFRGSTALPTPRFLSSGLQMVRVGISVVLRGRTGLKQEAVHTPALEDTGCTHPGLWLLWVPCGGGSAHGSPGYPLWLSPRRRYSSHSLGPRSLCDRTQITHPL